LLSKRYPALEKLLSQKLAVVKDMTLRSFGSVVEIDTHLFRIAVWKYCELSMGYLDPSYDYTNVNTLLKKPLRNFINKLLFKPKEIRIADLNALPYLFESHDLVHLIILVAEAKFYT
jgi:PA26 p53-induced protein (sestrin)